MTLAHMALWTRDLEAAAAFWRDFFGAEVGERYVSRRQAGFVSRFVRLPGQGVGQRVDQGVSIELMEAPWVVDAGAEVRVGWAHLALSLGGEAAVDAAAERFRAAGFLLSPPRHTGDGFYEAVVATPDGTPIEITA